MNGWSDLPAEILELICDGVGYPYDVRRIRSVCRSWRSSVPPPPTVLSPLFPHRISISSPPFTARKNHNRPIDLITKAVYLLRPNSDPSRAWMVSMEEANAGKLRLRDPITDHPIDISPDLSGWSVTEIARSHGSCFADGTAQVLRFDDWWTRPIIRSEPTKLATSGKVILVSHPPPKRSVCNFTFLVLHSRCYRVSALRLSDEAQVLEHVHTQRDRINDIVNFNGSVFAIDNKARVYSFDLQTLRPTRIDDTRFQMPWQILYGRKRLVVSNGELYMFSKFYEGNTLMLTLTACVVYKLVMDDDVGLFKWEYVENLGDQVFFITADSSFSVSAQHLPNPWRGNCVVFDTEGFCPVTMDLKFPKLKEIEVFHLGGQLKPLSCCYGYSDLFTPNTLKRASQTDCCGFVAGTSSTCVELRPHKKAHLFNPIRMGNGIGK